MAQSIFKATQFKPDFGIPFVPVHSKEVLATFPVERLREYFAARKKAEHAALQNPIAGGRTLPMWHKVMANWDKAKYHIICGGNRSGKSTFASRLSTWAAGTIPGAEVHCYQINKEKSIDEQQRYVYESIPVSIRDFSNKKGQHHSIQYSQKNGFTDNVCIFPPHSGASRGGSIRFHNYAQYADDPNTAESFKAHMLWYDEECPLDLFKTGHYRTLDYNGRIILTFTTITGWSPLVQSILGKARTIEKRWAPLLNRELPIVQEAMFSGDVPQAYIYYFWTEDNTFIISPEEVRKEMAGKPKEEILARAYGIPTKSVAGVFPGFGFSRETNVIAHDEIPFIKDKANGTNKYPVTRYMGIDPGGSKNWFMVWLAVDASDTWWIYAEWPDYDDWALPGNTLEGKAGPAQKGSKKGIKDYIELINDIEAVTGGVAYERFIDPRAGATERQGEAGAVTIITDLDDNGLFPPIRPAPLSRSSQTGGEIEVGIQLVGNKLAWNSAKPRDSLNAPHFYVSDRCVNMIYALSEYTARGGKDEATKDPCDALRMIAVADPQFYDLKPDNHPTGCY